MDLQSLNKVSFDKAIGILNTRLAELNGKRGPSTETKRAKCRNAIEVFTKAKAKLESTITTLKNTPDPSSSTGASYYDTIFAGAAEDTLTMSYIGMKMSGTPVTIDFTDVPSQANVNLNHNFIDKSKDFGNEVLDGKGRAIGFANGLLGLGIADVATKGVTSLLAKKGIMDSSLGLFGLAKKGLSMLPEVLPSVGASLSAFFTASSPIGWAIIGGAIAVKLLPAVKRVLTKIGRSLKADFGAQKQFQNNIDELYNAQPILT